MNEKEKKKLIGIVGLIFILIGVTGTIPSALNEFIVGIGGFGIVAVIGVVMSIYGFSE